MSPNQGCDMLSALISPRSRREARGTGDVIADVFVELFKA